MPVFRINISFADGARVYEYRVVDGVELDNYYSRVLLVAKKHKAPIKLFDVVQISELSLEAKTMRANNANKLSITTPATQPTQTRIVPKPPYRRRM